MRGPVDDEVGALPHPERGMTREELFTRLKAILVDTFQVDAAKITLHARLYEELEIDSIDVVDLAVQLHAVTGKRLAPDDFKAARTVQDVVDAAHRALTRPLSPPEPA